MTEDKMTRFERACETAANTAVASGAGLITGAMSGSPAVGTATEVAVGTVLHHLPAPVKAGTAIGAGMGGISAFHTVAAVGGVALAPAVGLMAVAAAAGGAVFGAAALIAHAFGVFDE
jgi:hypothetical protein